MAYNDTPLPGEAKNNIQPLARENFQILQAYITDNHDDIAVNNSALFGKHIKTQFTEQAVAPVPAVDQTILYGFLGAETAESELKFTRHEDADEILDATSSGKAVSGWTRLFSGLIIKWGTRAALDGDQYVVYATEIPGAPAFTVVHTAQVSIFGAGGADIDAAVRVTRFNEVNRMRVFVSHRYAVGHANARFTWFALGR